MRIKYKRFLSLLLTLSLFLTPSMTVFADGNLKNGAKDTAESILDEVLKGAQDLKDATDNYTPSESGGSDSKSDEMPDFDHAENAARWQQTHPQGDTTTSGEDMEKDASAGEGTEGTIDGVFDGASYGKTGYIIYASDESGHPNTPNHSVVFVSSYGNMPSGKNGNSFIDGRQTRFGDEVNTIVYNPVVWGFAPFSSGGDGMGDAIGDWLTSDYKDGYTGAQWILTNYMGMSDEAVNAYVAKEGNYMNVEAVMWAGIYNGTSYSGQTFCGTARTWAIMTDSRNFLGRYTHQNVPNSLVYDKSWLGLAVPGDIVNRHESGEITAPVGYGIVSVRCKPGDKEIIKVYRTKGVVDQTTYGSCDKHVTIKDEGSYKVKKWHVSKKKTRNKTPKRDYPTFESELPPTKSGGGPGETDLNDEEQTIIILLERDDELPPPRGENEDTLKAHELNYVFPNMASTGDTETASRKDNGTKPTEYDISEDLQNYIDENLTDDDSVPVKFENVTPEETFLVIEEKDGDITSLGGALLHRYNETYPIYKPWAEEKRFPVGTVIIPHYAYISDRYLWEPELVFCDYHPENGATSAWVTSVLKFKSGVVGEVTRAPMDYNRWDTLSETKSDSYKFTAKIRIDYDKTTGHFENSSDSDDSADADSNSSSSVIVWDSTSHLFDEPEFDIMSYSITHYCDKYRTQSIPQIPNENAGQKLETNGNCDPQSTTFTFAAAYSTQLSKTMTVYPEVAYTAWINSPSDVYADPIGAKAYMMGELARKCNPAILHAYKVTFDKRGITTLPAALTGTIAEKILNGGAGINQGVLAMGETFEVAWKGNVTIDCYTAGLDINDTYEGAVRSAWHDDGIKEAIKASHESFNALTAGRLDTQILMQYYDNSGNGGAIYDYYVLNAQQGKVIENPTEESAMDFTFKNGAIQEEGAIIGQLSSWGISGLDGGTLYNLWGMGKQVEDMFFSNTDPENASANAWVSESGIYSSDKWYDEESITMGVRFYHTRKTITGMLGVDKTDYNLIRQIQGWGYSGTGTEKALQARFFLRAFLMDGRVSSLGDGIELVIDGYDFSHVDEVMMFEIENTRFLLANLTTQDLHK